MDPLALAAGVILGGGALGGGVALGSRLSAAGRRPLEVQLQQQAAKLVDCQSWLEALDRHRETVRRDLAGLQGAVDAHRSRLEDLEERLSACNAKADAGLGRVEGQLKQLEQLEAFAAQAAAEVGELRQRLQQLPVQPVFPSAFAPAAPPAVMSAPQAAAASPAELLAAARSAQEEFARRQRQAMAGAFQQPPGGQ